MAFHVKSRSAQSALSNKGFKARTALDKCLQIDDDDGIPTGLYNKHTWHSPVSVEVG